MLVPHAEPAATCSLPRAARASRTIATSSEGAQALFNLGLLQAWGFERDEAAKNFEVRPGGMQQLRVHGAARGAEPCTHRDFASLADVAQP